ncbi:MAG: hypothetical protein QW291_02625 [Thermofilaceae archaeon]
MRAVILALCVLIAASFTVYAQPPYWIALNFKVTFKESGIVEIEAKLHPFSINGVSLVGEKEVESDLIEGSEEMTNQMVMMLTDNPRLLKYRVTARMERREDETVLCDVANTGQLTEFRGAYLLRVEAYLNTSNYVRSLNNSLFEVKIRDSFTSADPRSWIDVLELYFENVEVQDYRWEPPFAHGPETKTGSLLRWVNFNELEAPDFYVFTLSIPGFKYLGEPPEITAEITGAWVGKEGLHVKVRNLDNVGGYVYIRAFSEDFEQARKVYLPLDGERELLFPSINVPVEVELYSGSKLLGRTEASLSENDKVKPPATQLRITLPVLVALAVAAIIIALAVYVLLKRGGKELTYEDYAAIKDS